MKKEPTIRVVMMPKETNAWGTIFGGVILSYIDQAAGAEDQKQTDHRVVTVAMREVVFKKSVLVGDMVSFYTHVIKIGKTSITVKVDVIAQRIFQHKEKVEVTTAEVVFVAIDEKGNPTSVKGT